MQSGGHPSTPPPPPVIEDYPPVKSFSEAKSIFWTESVKIWRIGAPIIVSTLCLYGTGSFTSIFVGHLGDVQLSAVSIATSVIGIFSFGLMVYIYSLFYVDLGFCG